MLTQGELVQVRNRDDGILCQKMRELHVLIAGAGMVGGWTAQAIGRAVESTIIFDFDKVELENLSCQPYNQDAIGRYKVEALADSIYGFRTVEYTSKVEEVLEDPFMDGDASTLSLPDVVISAVDSLETRRYLAEWSKKNKIPLFIDSRVLGEIVCLFFVGEGEYDRYIAEIPEEDQVVDAPCGAKGTAYSGMFTASRITADLNRWCRGERIPYSRIWHVGLGIDISADEQKGGDEGEGKIGEKEEVGIE